MRIQKNPIDGGFRLEIKDKGYLDCKVYDKQIIFDCYTYPEHRKKGIFKILLNKLMADYSNMDILAAVTNMKIIPYLKSVGFKETKEYLPYWGRPENSVNLKKKKL